MRAANPMGAEKRAAGKLLGALLLAFLAAPAWGAPNPLPPEDQAKVNQAINKGVLYLRTHVSRDPRLRGTWAPSNSHTVGYAALPGLTLLECGVAPNDPQVQAAAAHVRAAMKSGKLDQTYELALSILFLDRLGEASDRALIQSMAARLIAGQTSSGGWSYRCPDLTPAQTREILLTLYNLNPPPPSLDPTARDPNAPGRSPGDLPGTGRDSRPPEEITQGTYPSPASLPRVGYCIKMSEEFPPPPKAVAELKPPKPPEPPKPVKVNIPPQWALLPVFQDLDLPPRPDPPGDHRTPGVTDNSNSQFAILALWAAKRHGVPMDRTLQLVVKRYRTSQNPAGTWGYRYAFGGGAGGSNAMTCVGLLGLAIGHGIAQRADAQQRAADDEMIKKGLLALHRMIGEPQQRMNNLPMENLYFLWSVERVGVLYNLPTILDKDWYRWGAEILVANQSADGSWTSQKYPGNTPQLDTCLALLFLKRANLARDLTRQLPYDAAKLNEELIARLPTEKLPPSPPNTQLENQSVQPPETAVRPPDSPSPPEQMVGTDRATENAGTPSAAQEEEPVSGRNWKFIILGAGLLVLLVVFGLLMLYVATRPADEEGRRRPHRRLASRRLRKVGRE